MLLPEVRTTQTCALPLIRADMETGLPRIEGYDVEAVIGRGGMGVVHQARHRKRNRPVAVRMILAGADASPQDRVRFQREAVAVAALRQQNAVGVYDSGEAGGGWELLGGRGSAAPTLMSLYSCHARPVNGYRLT